MGFFGAGGAQLGVWDALGTKSTLRTALLPPTEHGKADLAKAFNMAGCALEESNHAAQGKGGAMQAVCGGQCATQYPSTPLASKQGPTLVALSMTFLYCCNLRYAAARLRLQLFCTALAAVLASPSMLVSELQGGTKTRYMSSVETM